MPPATDTARRVGWLGSPIAKTSDGGKKKQGLSNGCCEGKGTRGAGGG